MHVTTIPKVTPTVACMLLPKLPKVTPTVAMHANLNSLQNEPNKIRKKSKEIC